MNEQDKLLNHLLNEAPFVPVSENLHDDIIVSAMLDTTAGPPASPSLKSQILDRINSPGSSDNIIGFEQLTPGTRRYKNMFGRQAGNALAGGLMAASLMIGLWAGATGTADPFLAASFELAGLQLPETDENFDPYNVIDGFDPSENLQ